jgi:hypothetical protein
MSASGGTSVTNTTVNIGNRFLSELSLVETLFVIIIGWVLVALWQRFIDNFTFNTLGLNEDSSYHTFIIAIAITVIFIVFLYSFQGLEANIIESDDSSISPPVTTPSTSSAPVTVSPEALKEFHRHLLTL